MSEDNNITTEEIRLRIVESAMKFIASSGPDGVITICEKLEQYVLGLDKAPKVPNDGVKARRPRQAL